MSYCEMEERKSLVNKINLDFNKQTIFRKFNYCFSLFWYNFLNLTKYGGHVILLKILEQ